MATNIPHESPEAVVPETKRNVVVFEKNEIVTTEELLNQAAAANENLRQTLKDIVHDRPQRGAGLLAAVEAIRAKRSQ